jgi:hypothetical protein
MQQGSTAMNTHPMGQPGEIMIDGGDLTTAALRKMTIEQLRHLGTRQVVYLRVGMHDGELAFVLHGADGTPLVTVDTVDAAVEMVAQHGLGFVAVH